MVKRARKKTGKKTTKKVARKKTVKKTKALGVDWGKRAAIEDKKPKKKVKKSAAPRPLEAAPTEDSAAYGCAHCGLQLSLKAMGNHLDSTKCGEYLRSAKLGPKFAKYVDVDPPTKEMAKARSRALVWVDLNSKPSLELRRNDTTVTFIPQVESGFAVERLSIDEFENHHVREEKTDRIIKTIPARTPVADYPTGRCAKLFVGFASDIGGTTEAITELEKLVAVTDEEKRLAEEKLSANKATRTVTTKVVNSKTGKVEVKAQRKARNTASTMFKGLIMEAKYTDDEIFDRVNKVFPMPESKRYYVSIYRSQLKKKGLNPPAPIGDKRKAKKRGKASEVSAKADPVIGRKTTKRKSKASKTQPKKKATRPQRKKATKKKTAKKATKKAVKAQPKKHIVKRRR